jgi:hypothetical protein
MLNYEQAETGEDVHRNTIQIKPTLQRYGKLSVLPAHDARGPAVGKSVVR